MSRSTIRFAPAAIVTAIALAFGTPVLAQSSGGSAQGGSNSMQSGTTPGSSGSAVQSGSAGSASSGSAMQQGAMTTGTTGQVGAANNSNSRVAPANPDAFDTSSWANEYARSNQGRITREAYLEEMGKRWDRYDTSKQGLTPEYFGRTTGNTPAQTGSDVKPGYMGPGSVKAQ